MIHAYRIRTAFIATAASFTILMLSTALAGAELFKWPGWLEADDETIQDLKSKISHTVIGKDIINNAHEALLSQMFLLMIKRTQASEVDINAFRERLVASGIAEDLLSEEAARKAVAEWVKINIRNDRSESRKSIKVQEAKELWEIEYGEVSSPITEEMILKAQYEIMSRVSAEKSARMRRGGDPVAAYVKDLASRGYPEELLALENARQAVAEDLLKRYIMTDRFERKGLEIDARRYGINLASTAVTSEENEEQLLKLVVILANQNSSSEQRAEAVAVLLDTILPRKIQSTLREVYNGTKDLQIKRAALKALEGTSSDITEELLMEVVMANNEDWKTRTIALGNLREHNRGNCQKIASLIMGESPNGNIVSAVAEYLVSRCDDGDELARKLLINVLRDAEDPSLRKAIADIVPSFFADENAEELIRIFHAEPNLSIRIQMLEGFTARIYSGKRIQTFLITRVKANDTPLAERVAIVNAIPFEYGRDLKKDVVLLMLDEVAEKAGQVELKAAASRRLEEIRAESDRVAQKTQYRQSDSHFLLSRAQSVLDLAREWKVNGFTDKQKTELSEFIETIEKVAVDLNIHKNSPKEYKLIKAVLEDINKEVLMP